MVLVVLAILTAGALLPGPVPAPPGAGPSGAWKRRTEAALPELRARLNLYLKALTATPKELEALRAQDPAEGIWLMERNPFLRARLELVAILSDREREDLLRGSAYLSPPHKDLPKRVQELMRSAVGTRGFEGAALDALRYRLQVRSEDGVQHLMINQVDPAGKGRSGGSVMPGVRLAPKAP
jgi:hypothetical protein